MATSTSARARPDHLSATGARPASGTCGQLPARRLLRGRHSAGGVAMLLPPQPVDADIADRVLDGLDGLVITGGRDVDPAAYGQPPHPTTDEPPAIATPGSSRWSRGALARGLPVLGICRGAQVLNVALGGTLHQHLPDVVGHNWHQAGNAVFSTSVDPDRARHPVGRVDRRVHRRAVLSPPGHRRARRGPDRQRVGCRRRGRGGRAARATRSSSPCSGIRRSDSTICDCSPASSAGGGGRMQRKGPPRDARRH